jgi:DNA adenine methylase
MQHYPVIPWIGGKRRLAKTILPLFPEHTCYCEPFCGAAALFFLKPISKAEVLNDISGDLVNLYRVIQHHLEEFCRQFKWALVSRELFRWLSDTPPHVLTDIQRAARFYYLQKMGFGGKVVGRTFGTAATSPPRLNLLRLEEDLSQAHLRLARVTIEHLSWQICVAKYDRPSTFFFCDPPYRPKATASSSRSSSTTSSPTPCERSRAKPSSPSTTTPTCGGSSADSRCRR